MGFSRNPDEMETTESDMSFVSFLIFLQQQIYRIRLLSIFFLFPFLLCIVRVRDFVPEESAET